MNSFPLDAYTCRTKAFYRRSLYVATSRDTFGKSKMQTLK